MVLTRTTRTLTRYFRGHSSGASPAQKDVLDLQTCTSYLSAKQTQHPPCRRKFLHALILIDKYCMCSLSHPDSLCGSLRVQDARPRFTADECVAPRLPPQPTTDWCARGGPPNACPKVCSLYRRIIQSSHPHPDTLMSCSCSNCVHSLEESSLPGGPLSADSAKSATQCAHSHDNTNPRTRPKCYHVSTEQDLSRSMHIRVQAQGCCPLPLRQTSP